MAFKPRMVPVEKQEIERGELFKSLSDMTYPHIIHLRSQPLLLGGITFITVVSWAPRIGNRHICSSEYEQS